MIARLLRRLRYFLNRRQMQRELADEMAAHRAMMPDDRRNKFGSELRVQEDAREVWAWTWLDRFRQDLVYAARTFRRSSGFTLGAVAVLALGVGVNVADFQIFDAIFNRLSIPGADSIVQIARVAKRKQSAGVPYPAIRVYQKNCALCAYVVSENMNGEVTVEGESGVRSGFVSGNYFRALGISPAWGRLLTEDDDSPAAAAVAVLGYEYWKNSWAGESAVVGRTLHINGRIFRIVGVMPYDFDGLILRRTAVWLPAVRRSMMAPGGPPPESFTLPDHMLFARPRPGVALAAMEAQLTSISHSLVGAAPLYFLPDERAVGERLMGTGWDFKRTPAKVLLIPGLVLLVLLSACANLANMLLARGLARERELNTRMFLGAGRVRMIRQLVTENLLLALLGGAAALVVGHLASEWLLRALDAPPDIRVSANWRYVCAGVALALFSVVAFGLPAALGIARPAHQSGRRRQLLVALQVAISCLLLISSAIIVRGGIRSATIDLAFDYQRMIVVDPQLYSQRLTPVVARQKLDALVDRLGSLPGVDSIAEAATPPLGYRFDRETLPGLPPLWLNPVAPSYFAAMKISLVRGRTFQPGEENAVIVSESAARAVWPNQDPIGKTWDFAKGLRTVVGVVKDSGANLIADSESVETYIPDTGGWIDRAALILHTKGDPAPLMRSIVVASSAAGEPVGAELMRSSHERAIDEQFKLLTVFGSLSVVATALAAAGMFALVAFAVAQRTREIGIRMAIGAGPSSILHTLLNQNVGPVIFGVLAGTAAGIGLGKIVRGMMFLPVNPLDAEGFAWGIAAFCAIAALATLSPALNALRIDPASTLRSD